MRVRLTAVMTVLLVLLPAAAAHATSKNIWVSGADIAAAPTTGTAWTKVSADAELAKTCVPSLTVLSDDCDVDTLAAAYKAVRLNDATLYQAVQDRIAQLPTTPTDRALELARNLTSYVIAADVIDLPARNATLNATFTSWLEKLATTYVTTGGDCPTLTRCEELRPNNWGAMSAAALAATNAYLGNATRLDHVFDVEKAWAGVRSGTYNPASFNFAPNAVSYGPDGSTEATLVGINPAAAVTQGHDTDGLQPDDQRRRTTVTTATGTTITDAPFVWPLPKDTSYPWESLQGRIVAAQILTRSGRDMYQVAGQALRRAVDFLYRTKFDGNADGIADVNWPAEGDDLFLTAIVNQAYGTTYAGIGSDWTGKNMGYTNWVVGSSGTVTSTPPPPPPPPVDTTPPTTPTGLAATGVTASSATLGWTVSTDNVGVDHYVVTRNGAVVNSAVADASFTFTGLTCGTTYTLGVKAVDAAGNASPEATLAVTTDVCAPADTTPPPAPAVTPASGTFSTAQQVTMSDTEAGATIRYTVGTGTTVPPDPTATTGTVYTAPFTVSTSQVIKAVAVDDAGNVSTVTQRNYTIPVTQTLAPDADAYVDSGSPRSNFGTGTTLADRNGSPTRISYLRFTIPDGAPPLSAKLRLNQTTATNATADTVKIASPTTWSETTITYNTRLTPTAWPGAGLPTALGWNEAVIPVAQLTPNQTVTFIITRGGTSTTTISRRSRENTTTASRPQLVLTY